MKDDGVKLSYVREETVEFEPVEPPKPPGYPRRPTFPPPSRGGAPEWAQYHPETGLPRTLIEEEQSAFRRFSPRRSRWPEVAAFDARVSELDTRRAKLVERVGELQQQIAQAEEGDRQALAEWTVDPAPKKRPKPTAPGLRAELEEATAEADALGVAVARVLEEKAEYVGQNRKRLISQADAETRKLEERYEAQVGELEATREELVEMRQATIWPACYGTPAAAETMPTANLAAGLAEPVKRTLGIRSQIPAANVFEALRVDARVLATCGTHAQLEALGERTAKPKAAWESGKPDIIGPRFPAAWAGSDEEAELNRDVDRYTEATRRRLEGEGGG